MKKELDITENIASGDMDHIISILKKYREIGFDRLYWDGYDSSIHLYKSINKVLHRCEDKTLMTQCYEIGGELIFDAFRNIPVGVKFCPFCGYSIKDNNGH